MSRRQPAPPPELPGFTYVEADGFPVTGGFADVYMYNQLGLDRLVAIKVLVGGVGTSDLAAFQAEANLMARLSNHASIVSIYQADITSDGRPFLVMEYCPPPHLGLRIRARSLSVAKALEIAIQVSGAVETAHRLDILHRDIKPANILFTEFGRPALTDFGISVTTHSGAAGEGVGMSVPWAPPEQLTTGSPMGPPGDVYSLAATIWTALAGRAPFHIPGAANTPNEMVPRIRNQPVPSTQRDDVPESLERVLRRAMAKSPRERFGSALEFARALQTVQAELHQSITPIEIRDQRIVGNVVDDEGEGGTKVTGFISIDPDVRNPATITGITPLRYEVPSVNTGSNTQGSMPLVHGIASDVGSGIDSGIDDTVTPAQLPAGLPVHPEADEQAPTTQPAASRVPIFATLGVVGVVVAIGASLALGGGPGTTGTRDNEADPSRPAGADPLGEAIPTPTEVTVNRQKGGALAISWTNPAPLAGDKYAYKLNDPIETRSWEFTTEPSAVVEGEAGRECVLVQLVRSDGRASASAEACPEESP